MPDEIRGVSAGRRGRVPNGGAKGEQPELNVIMLSLKLTPREREVLALFVTLLNDKKVARHLRTQVQTVKNQLASIEHKLGVGSRNELIALVLSMNA